MVPEKIEQHWRYLYTDSMYCKWFVSFERMLARCFQGEDCISQDDWNRLCIVDGVCFVFSAYSSWIKINEPVHDKLMRLYTQYELERAIFSEVDCE